MGTPISGMRRAPKWFVSRSLYAIDLSSLAVHWYGNDGYGQARVDAVWYRKQRGVLSASAGHLWDGCARGQEPATVQEFLARIDTGVYGPTVDARWDGSTLWTPSGVSPAAAERHRALLDPMLREAAPYVPDGYDGWWEFNR